MWQVGKIFLSSKPTLIGCWLLRFETMHSFQLLPQASTLSQCLSKPALIFYSNEGNSYSLDIITCFWCKRLPSWDSARDVIRKLIIHSVGMNNTDSCNVFYRFTLQNLAVRHFTVFWSPRTVTSSAHLQWSMFNIVIIITASGLVRFSRILSYIHPNQLNEGLKVYYCCNWDIWP